MEPIDAPVYDEAPWRVELRRIRVDAGISLRGAANVLGIPAIELSGLEHGQLDFETATDRFAVFSLLQDMAAVVAGEPE